MKHKIKEYSCGKVITFPVCVCEVKAQDSRGPGTGANRMRRLCQVFYFLLSLWRQMAACLTAHKPGKPEPAEPGNPAGRSVGPQAGPTLPSHICHSPQMRLQLEKTAKQNNNKKKQRRKLRNLQERAETGVEGQTCIHKNS